MRSLLLGCEVCCREEASTSPTTQPLEADRGAACRQCKLLSCVTISQNMKKQKCTMRPLLWLPHHLPVCDLLPRFHSQLLVWTQLPSTDVLPFSCFNA